MANAPLKLEGENPWGSIKDRTAKALIEDLEQRGLLFSETTTVESTSGNLGKALAAITRLKGLQFRAVVDPKTPPALLQSMRELGAEIDMVSEPDAAGGYLLTRLARVKELCASSPNFVWTNQYGNAANPRAHFEGTGPEILRDMGGNVDLVFIPVSTGGTLAGVGRYLRLASPRTKIIGVDAVGSVVFGTPPGPRLLTGIGSSQRSRFLTPDLYDSFVQVSDEQAFSCCRTLHAVTGIKVGGSSGAAIFACGQYLAKNPTCNRAVCICPDKGENYDETIYNDKWLQANGLWPDLWPDC